MLQLSKGTRIHAVAAVTTFLGSAACTVAVAAALVGGPAGASAAAGSADAASTPPAVVAAYPALAHPTPDAARAITKPNAVGLFVDHDPGLDIAAATVIRDTPDLSLVLMPRADGQLCLLRLPSSGASSANCVDDDVATTRGVVNGTPGHVFGVVPSDVRTIAFDRSGGATTRTPVADDGYFEAPSDAIGGQLVTNGVAVSLGRLVPERETPPGMIIER